MKFLWVSRLFAVALIFGGAGGFIIFILTANQLSRQDWMSVFSASLFATLSLCAITIGVALWRDSHYSKRWAAILFALQVPVLSSPTFSYEWFTGIAIKLVGSKGTFHWFTELGGSNNFHLQSNVTDATYGVNVFAVGALIYLAIVCTNNLFKPKSL